MTVDDPVWLAPLQADTTLTERLELVWLPEEERETLRDEWLAIWQRLPFGEAFISTCAARIARCTPLAYGLTRRRRFDMAANQLLLIFDPEQPDQPWISLSAALPSLLWVAGAPSAEALLERLEPYIGDDRPSMLQLTGRARIYKPIEVEDPSVVTAAVQQVDMWVDDASWGSAHYGDYWDDVEADPNFLRLNWLRQDAAREQGDRFPATGYRTLWSRSIMRIEQLPFGAWVFDLHYMPVPDHGVLEQLKAAIDVTLPADLPLDLAACLLRDEVALPELIEANCDAHTDALLAKVSIDLGEPSSVDLLAGWIARSIEQDPEQLMSLVELASTHQMEQLLFTTALALPAGHEVRAALEAYLQPEGGEA